MPKFRVEGGELLKAAQEASLASRVGPHLLYAESGGVARPTLIVNNSYILIW
jgi:hypothetical protein